jgi:hypothetical protein
MVDSITSLSLAANSHNAPGGRHVASDGPAKRLCDVCSKIDLSNDYSRLQGVSWQEINRSPLEYSVIHMRSTEMIVAANTCPLCALVLENIGDLSDVEYVYRRLISRSLGQAGAYETDCILFGRSDDIPEENHPVSIGLFVPEGRCFDPRVCGNHNMKQILL